MEKKYYEKIDILRGFAIFLVILGHAVDPANIATSSVMWCSQMHTYIYSFHMALFFAISGFCLFNISSYLQFIKKKTRYILIPYFVFNFGAIILRKVIPQFSLESKNIKDSIISIFIDGGELWFLYVLFELFIIAPFLIKIINNKLSHFIIVEIALIITYVCTYEITVFRISEVLFYMIFFLGGNMLQKKDIIKEEQLFSIPIRCVFLLITILIQIVLLLVKQTIVDCVILTLVVRILLALVGCVFSYLLICLISQKTINKALKNYGQYSLQIYLFNGYFIAVSRTIFLTILELPIPVVVLFNFIFGLFFNYVWCYFILKIRFIRLLCGKK